MRTNPQAIETMINRMEPLAVPNGKLKRERSHKEKRAMRKSQLRPGNRNKIWQRLSAYGQYYELIREKHHDLTPFITFSAVLDGHLDKDKVVQAFANLSQRYIRLRQVILDKSKTFYWSEPLEELDVSAQIYEVKNWMGRPEPDDIVVALKELASVRVNQPMPGNRPPWEGHIIHKPSTNESAFLLRCHHAIGDGDAIVAMISDLCTEAENLNVPLSQGGAFKQMVAQKEESVRRAIAGAQPLKTVPSPIRAILIFFYMIWAWIYAIWRVSVPYQLLRDDVNPFNGKHRAHPSKYANATKKFMLSDLKPIARANKITLNDVLLSILGGGMRRYIKHHGQNPDDINRFRGVCTMNLRAKLPEPDEDGFVSIGNAQGFFYVHMPIKVQNAVERAQLINRETRFKKTSPEATFCGWLVRTMSVTWPDLFLDLIVAGRAPVISYYFSNIMGPPLPVALCGCRVKDVLGFVSPGQAACFAVPISYNDGIRICISGDADSIPDSDVLVKFIEEEAADFMDAAADKKLQ
eukprot:Clim_evm25s158 gene=Clim_evmTU25s158